MGKLLKISQNSAGPARHHALSSGTDTKPSDRQHFLKIAHAPGRLSTHLYRHSELLHIYDNHPTIYRDSYKPFRTPAIKISHHPYLVHNSNREDDGLQRYTYKSYRYESPLHQLCFSICYQTLPRGLSYCNRSLRPPPRPLTARRPTVTFPNSSRARSRPGYHRHQ